jgi:hypothetical protein
MPPKRQKLSESTDKVLLTLPKDLYDRVKRLAEQSDITPQHFMRRILTEAAESDVIYPPHAGVFEDQATYPKKKAK